MDKCGPGTQERLIEMRGGKQIAWAKLGVRVWMSGQGTACDVGWVGGRGTGGLDRLRPSRSLPAMISI